MDDDPIARFNGARERARGSEPLEATACALATVDASGQPSVRMVLVRDADESGFVFYTNFESRKARDLAGNPRAALCFHWQSIGEQIRIEGSVERVSAALADRYFALRPRMSQVGAWASSQSEPLLAREVLDARVADCERRFAGADVPRPTGWGGYRVIPEVIEFWIEGKHRLHDRFEYRRAAVGWSVRRLFP